MRLHLNKKNGSAAFNIALVAQCLLYQWRKLVPRRSAGGRDLHQGSEVSSTSLVEASGPPPSPTPPASPGLQECAAQGAKEWPGACRRQRSTAQCCKEVVKGSLGGPAGCSQGCGEQAQALGLLTGSLGARGACVGAQVSLPRTFSPTPRPSARFS